ncbi:hypothetical protein V9T40_004197 [Parthenolecanium corni]|uniref:Uncharacterized protein n=1 Tax=Parthenolecanium corni TaxID=536013 RepID=A0AAN9TRI1_9HEMI
MKRVQKKKPKVCGKRRVGDGRPRFSFKSMTVDGEKIFIVRHQASQIYILGTNHVDRRYVLMVRKLLNGLKPDAVGVELCRTRTGYKHLMTGDEHPSSLQSEFQFRLIPAQWRRLAIGEKLGLLYAYGAIRYAESKSFRVELLRYRQMRTYKLRPPTQVDDLVIGAELLAPFRNFMWRSDGADSKYLSNSCTHYKILLLDRPVQQTYALLAEALTDQQKQLILNYKENFEREFISCKEQNKEPIIATLMLNRQSKLYEIFVDQRDEHMAETMFAALVKDGIRKVFCIVGRTHVNGVLVKLNQLFKAKMAKG